MNWESPNDNICPSSIAKYFADLKYDVKLCVPDNQIRTNYIVKVPKLENVSEFVEWLGLFSLDVDFQFDNYLTTYETPRPYEEYGQVKFLQWKGFFTCQRITKLLEELKRVIKKEDYPWVSVYVQGFSDVPVSWNKQEHHFYTNGDNAYVIIVTPDVYWIYKQMCSSKRYK
ncbi:hypothetical protein FQA39_LY05127 [Lamprigera yunnana]|nr:hypothetical protein FQA39_LY05127 [Lamprigera yunnana]